MGGLIPVVAVTSRDVREDREPGIEPRADVYIVDGTCDQDWLLNTVRRLI